MDEDPLGFATDSSSVSTTPQIRIQQSTKEFVHVGENLQGDEEDELPSLEEPSGVAPAEQTAEEWLEWYQETFSSELALINSKQQANSGSMLLGGEGNSRSTELTTTLSEADRLRRRLQALDAVEELGGRVDSTAQPISSRLWEADAPQCHGCREDLGITRLKRRHHCRFCGLTFCHDCAPGEIRTCKKCRANRTRGDALRLIRAFERQALQKGAAGDMTKEDVLCVARAYRSAMEAFAGYEQGEDVAKKILLEGVHSFLDLDEVRSCVGSRLNLSGLSFSPRE